MLNGPRCPHCTEVLPLRSFIAFDQVSKTCPACGGLYSRRCTLPITLTCFAAMSLTAQMPIDLLSKSIALIVFVIAANYPDASLVRKLSDD